MLGEPHILSLFPNLFNKFMRGSRTSRQGGGVKVSMTKEGFFCFVFKSSGYFTEVK